MSTIRILAAAVFASACALAQAQVNGVTINQAKALQGGITPGDEPGFPITLSQPGSYRLVGNLSMPAGAIGAIVVMADRVTIDLNGFSITGPGTCSGAASVNKVCSDAVSYGVILQPHKKRLAISNGSVGGFGYCVYGGASSRVSDLSLHNCHQGLDGMTDGSIVTRVSIDNSRFGANFYGATADLLQLHDVQGGVHGQRSLLRSVSMDAVGTAFLGFAVPSGPLVGTLTQSLINATHFGAGVRSMGDNQCKGVAC